MKTPLEMLAFLAERSRDTLSQTLVRLDLDESLEAYGIANGIDGLKKVPTSDHVLVGTAHIFFVPMNVVFIRVSRDGDHGEDLVAIDYEWQAEVDNLSFLSPDHNDFQTTEIPTMEGEWLVYMHPVER
jgi:hypothetical protein